MPMSRRGGVSCRGSSEAGLPERIANALTVDVEEYYHGYEFEAALGVDDLRRLPSRVVGQTQRLLDVLDAHRARGTFFTLGVVAQRHPRLAREIVERGHELASHGWDHTPVFRLGPAGFRADVRRAKNALEQASSRLVRGYRAPNYSIRRDTPWAFRVLVEEGFVYDSSMYPLVHDRYGFPNAPRFPHIARSADGIDFWEVPVGTARFAGVNLPLGGGFFRLFPAALVHGAIASVNTRDRRPAVFYVHPWELDPGQPRPRMTFVQRFRHYTGLAAAERKLTRLLAAFSFASIETTFEEVRPARRAVARAS
jgi:polysaccharide deacetylase family protein (PEP-CTERM system associated)